MRYTSFSSKNFKIKCPYVDSRGLVDILGGLTGGGEKPTVVARIPTGYSLKGGKSPLGYAGGDSDQN